jgi:LemA protein
VTLETGRPAGPRFPRWLIPVSVIVAILLFIVFPLVGSYNGLVGREAAVDQSFADLDAQLQRRNDLIPNLVAAVKAVLKQEQAVFGEIARARQNYAGANTTSEKAQASGQIDSALARLLVIVEQYPQLRSNENVRDLQVQLEGTENRVAQARREYNAVATNYNVNIRQFPRALIAGLFGFDRKPLFNAPASARQNPNVDLDDAFTPAPSGQ